MEDDKVLAGRVGEVGGGGGGDISQMWSWSRGCDSHWRWWSIQPFVGAPDLAGVTGRLSLICLNVISN